MEGFGVLLANRASWDAMLGLQCRRRNHQVPHPLLIPGRVTAVQPGGTPRWTAFGTFLCIPSQKGERERENNVMIPLCPSADPQQNSLQEDSNSPWFLTFLTISVTENPVQLQSNPWQPSLDLWYMSHMRTCIIKKKIKNCVSATSFVRKLSPSPFWRDLPMRCSIRTGVLSKCYTSILTWFSVSHLTAILKTQRKLINCSPCEFLDAIICWQLEKCIKCNRMSNYI